MEGSAFRKKKGPARPVLSFEESDVISANAAAEEPVVVIRKRANKPKAVKLSFDEEEDEVSEVSSIEFMTVVNTDGNDTQTAVQSSFKVKKGNTATGRRLLQPSSNPSPSTSNLSIPAPDPDATTTAPSTYSKEFLNQLKATTLSAPVAESISNNPDEYDSLTQSKFARYNEYTTDLTSTSSTIPSTKIPLIPTSSTINSARESRERLRYEGARNDGAGESGYIGLEVVGTSNAVGLKGKGKESRLVRDEDDLGDGDEGTYLSHPIELFD